MAELIAIGYPDEKTAEKAAEEVTRLADQLVIEPEAVETTDKVLAALSKFGGTVLKTSLSKEAEEQMQQALQGSPQAATVSSR